MDSAIELTCSERGCAQKFLLTQGEVDYYNGLKWDVPKRCPFHWRREREKRESNEVLRKKP